MINCVPLLIKYFINILAWYIIIYQFRGITLILTKQETFAFYLHSNPDVNVLWRLLFNGIEIRTYFQAKSLQVSRIPPCVRDSREIQRDSIHNFNLPRAERKKRTRGLGKREAGMKDERATFGRKERPSGDVSRE